MCCRRADLVLENLALRQQVAVLKKHRPRPTLGDTDRTFWVALSRRMAGMGEPLGPRAGCYHRLR